MRKQTVQVSLAIIVAILLACGCASDVTVPGSSGGNKKHTLYGLILSSDPITHQFYAYTASGSGYLELSNGNRQVFSITTQNHTLAVVNPDQGVLIYNGGNVPANGDGYTYQSFNLPVQVTGNAVTWSIVGGPLNGWSSSLASPPAAVQITSPVNAVCQSKSNNLAISWNPQTTTPTMTVLIEVYSNETDSTGSATASLRATTTDVGSHVFPASSLAGLRDGKHTVVVRRGFFNIGNAPDGKKFVVAHFTQHSNEICLTP